MMVTVIDISGEDNICNDMIAARRELFTRIARVNPTVDKANGAGSLKQIVLYTVDTPGEALGRCFRNNLPTRTPPAEESYRGNDAVMSYHSKRVNTMIVRGRPYLPLRPVMNPIRTPVASHGTMVTATVEVLP